MKKQFRITLNGKSYDVVAELIGEEPAPVAEAAGSKRPARSTGGSAASPAPAAAKAPAPQGGSGDVPSPLAGKVVSLDVSIGQSVQAGQKLITMEAMKMNTVVSSPVSGTIKAIHVSPGDAVEEGQPLLKIA